MLSSCDRRERKETVRTKLERLCGIGRMEIRDLDLGEGNVWPSFECP